jgi:GAF domain-containing protein
LAQRYDPQGILPPSGQWRETLRQAVHDRKSVADEQRESVALAIPIQVREQVIGVLDAHKPKEAGGWTDEEIALIQTLVDQLSVALDSARLYQDAQRRAVRERLIGDTTARMRESLELETLLKTAATEMRRALDLKDLVIRLATPEEDEPMGEVSLQRR